MKMNDRQSKFIEASLKIGSRLKLRLEEGYYVGNICKPPAEADRLDTNEPCVTMDEVVLKTAISPDCKFPLPISFQFSEVEDFEILDDVLSSDSFAPRQTATNFVNTWAEKVNADVPQNGVICENVTEVPDQDSSEKCIAKVSKDNSPKQLGEAVPQKESPNNLNDEIPQNICLEQSNNAANALNPALKANVNSSKENLDVAKTNGSDPRLKGLYYYGEKFECQLTNGNANRTFTYDLPKTYFLIDIRTFFKIALDIIKNEKEIGCAFDGVNLGSNGILSAIQISTKDYIFILDAISLGKNDDFIDDLKSILENDEILKVTHDCRKASQLLRYQFDIYLTNVHDLQVADIMIQRLCFQGGLPKYVRCLLVLLVNYLDLSQEDVQFFHDRRTLVENEKEIWAKRPMTKSLVELAALNVRYFLELKRKTAILLMSEFRSAVNIYVNYDNNQEEDVLVPSEFSRFNYSGQSHDGSPCSSISSNSKQKQFSNFIKGRGNCNEKRNYNRKVRFNTSKDSNSTASLEIENGSEHDSSLPKNEINDLNEGLHLMDMHGMDHNPNNFTAHPQRFGGPPGSNGSHHSNNFQGRRNNYRGRKNNYRGTNNNYRGTNRFEGRNVESKPTMPKPKQIYPTGMYKME